MQEAENVGNDNGVPQMGPQTGPKAGQGDATARGSAATTTGRLHLRVLDDGENNTYTGIGEELKAIRERRGETVKEVADALRIRAVLIDALESGSFDDLPGDIYVMGFLKTYATHLDQNPEDVIARFKAERSEEPVDPVYNFPKPVKEDSAPKGPLLIVALLLAVGIYGTWYWSNQSDKVDVSQTPAVPERFATLPDTWNQQDEQMAAASTAPVTAPQTDTEQTADEQSVAITDATPVDEAGQIATPLPMSEATAQTDTDNTLAKTEADMPTGTGETATDIPAPATVSTAPSSTPAAEDMAAYAAQEPAESVAATTQEEPVVMGNLTLRATGSVWVQVKNENGLTRYSGIMRKDDTYAVSSEEKLFLMTGDAGALEISDNETVLGVLGSTGEAKTHVPLTLTGIKNSMKRN